MPQAACGRTGKMGDTVPTASLRTVRMKPFPVSPAPAGAAAACALCQTAGGTTVWRGSDFRLVRAAEPALPAFYRVIWQQHVAEFTDLTALQRLSCIDAVVLVEQTLRAQMQPDKINLGSLGNVVPHLHWHVVARWQWDAFWPQSPWSAPQRPVDDARLQKVREHLPALDGAMHHAFAARFGASRPEP